MPPTDRPVPLAARRTACRCAVAVSRALRTAVRVFSGPLAACVLGLVPAGDARASAPDDMSAICDQAAAEAARQTGVPFAVLMAISLTETGRKRSGAFRPWPWTVNMEGKGLWFDSADDARAYVYAEYKRGARSFDVGCFQINYKWHGQAFASIEAMFDPVANAVYAAEFLRDLYAEKQSWSAAAGSYHSRTPEFAERYRVRFDSIHNRLAGDPAATGTADGAASGGPLSAMRAPATADGIAPSASDIPDIPDIVLVANGGQLPADGLAEPRQPRLNTFPLLQAGSAGSNGSLVPIMDRTAGGVSLFGTAEPLTDIE